MKFSSVLTLAAAMSWVEASNYIDAYANDHYKGHHEPRISWTEDYELIYCLSFNADSYKYHSTPGDGCCMRLCNNGQSVVYKCGSHDDPSPPKFDQINMGCGVPLYCLDDPSCEKFRAAGISGGGFFRLNATTAEEDEQSA